MLIFSKSSQVMSDIMRTFLDFPLLFCFHCSVAPVNASSTLAWSHYIISMLWPDPMSVGANFLFLGTNPGEKSSNVQQCSWDEDVDSNTRRISRLHIRRYSAVAEWLIRRWGENKNEFLQHWSQMKGRMLGYFETTKLFL